MESSQFTVKRKLPALCDLLTD